MTRPVAGRPASQGGTPVRTEFLPYALPTFGPEEKSEILAALESGWITTGPRTRRFEEALAAYTGSPHVICLDSGTAAMHVALVLLDLQPGDEVITSSLTFCSTVSCIVHAGGKPVLVDVSPDTLNLDPVAVERAATDRTRAVMPVHYGGHPCDMDAIGELAARRGWTVIEDAAHAIGARWRDRPVGNLSDATAFSFYANKNLTTAEGGALLLRDAAQAERARLLSLHGMSKDAWKRYTAAGSWFYEVVLPGFKYNMTDLEAALGIHQLAKLDGFNARRREIAGRLTAGLSGDERITLPVERDEVTHAWHLYAIRLDPERLTVDRARFIDELKAENIGTSVNFIPIHFHPYFRDLLGLERGAFPVAETAYEGLISLPIYPRMTDRDTDDVIAAVSKLTRAFSR